MRAATLWCTERGIDEMRLHNAASSADAAGAWEALGFEVVEHVRRRSLREAPSRSTAQPMVHAEAR